MAPRGPNGEHRPADVVGCAVHVAKEDSHLLLANRHRPRGDGLAAGRLHLPRGGPDLGVFQPGGLPQGNSQGKFVRLSLVNPNH